MMRFKSALLGSLLCVIFLSGGFLTPAARGEESNTCGLSKGKFDILGVAGGTAAADYMEQIRAELRTRKGLLKETVDCAIKEASSLKSNLERTDAADAEARQIRANFSGRLDDILRYYSLQRSKIDDLGIAGSQEFAREFKSWRRNNYNSLAQQTLNFMLWTNNQSLMQTAQNRIGQINQTVSLMRLVGNDETQNLFREARSNLDEAWKANQKAKESFSQYGEPNDSLNTIKESLDALSKTYQKFFELRESIKKVLPQE